MFWRTVMVKHQHTGSGRLTPDDSHSSGAMRNGNQPPDASIKDETLATGGPDDPHAPIGDTLLDNVRDAPRDNTGVIEGVSTAEKLGYSGPTPGAPLDPPSPGVGPLSTQVFFLLLVVVVLLGVVVLATIL
jgi:hypothetical protein